MTTSLEQHALDNAPIIPTLDGGAHEVPDLAKAVQNNGVWPRFHMVAKLNKKQSDEAGRPMHDQVEWVDVVIAGDRNSQPSHKVTDIDKHKWPDEYSAFKNGAKMPVQGTPLSEWNQLSVSQVADLTSIGVLTVDMLADLSDSQIQGYGMGGMQLREKAKAFIETSADQAIPQHLATQNAKLTEDMTFMEKQVEDMKAALAKAADNPESTERVEQMEAMCQTQKTTIATLEESAQLLRDKVKLLEAAEPVDVTEYTDQIKQLTADLTTAKQELSTAKGNVTKLTNQLNSNKPAKPPAKKAD